MVRFIAGGKIPPGKAKTSFILILLLLLMVDCAMLPELDSSRTDRIAAGPEFSPYYGLKRRIAILDFENLSDLGGSKFGSAISDQLISLVARSNRYSLIERSQIERILHEQALGQSGVVSEQTAPEVGKMLGVEAVVLGKILSASESLEQRTIDHEKDKWSLKIKTMVGRIQLAYKIVDTTTGEVLLANDITEREMRPSFGLKTKTIDLENWADFDDTVLGMAVRKALNRMAEEIVAYVSRIGWVGTVVQCKGDTVVYFTPGRNAGIQLAQLFDIYAKSSVQPDSTVISELANQPQLKARIQVVGFIGDRVTRAQVVDGADIQRGDSVKPVQHYR